MIWKPDTCECVLEYKDSGPNDADHFVGVVSSCKLHADFTDVECHNQVLFDNQTKNQTLAQIAESYPELTKTDENGNVTLKSGAVEWSYADDRTLTVSIPSLDDAQKSDLQTATSATVNIA